MQVTTSHRRRPLALAVVTILALVWGMLGSMPSASAATTFKAPTGLKVAAVSGSNGLKVTWTASAAIDGSAAKPSHYVVKYGTSSSISKATTRTYQLPDADRAPIYVISGAATSTTYYVWVAAADESGAAISTFTSAVKATTSKYKYKAPVEIFAVNATKTTIELAWRTVTGAPAYRLRAVGGGATKYQSTGSDGTAIFKGLKPGTSYTFTVSVIQPATVSVPGEVKMSPDSSKKAVRSTTAAANYDAPTDLKAADQDHSSITLTWKAPAEYNPASHDIRVDYAEDQNMKDNPKSAYPAGANATGGVLKSLSSNTNYYVRVVVVTKPDAEGKRTAVSDRTEAILAKTRSPKGFIAGKVAGVSEAVLRDYVVAAYSAKTGDVNQQVIPDSSGNYKIELRPGDYYLQAIYLGTGNYTTLWARAGTNGSRIRTDPEGGASRVTVVIGKTPVNAPTITVGQGGTINGDIDCPGDGECTVDVAAISDFGTGNTPTVIGQTRSSDSGAYSIAGLTRGNYRLRFNYAGDGFKIGNGNGNVSGAGASATVDKALSNRDFIRTYALTVGGTKAVGKTLSVSSRAPLAAEYPTTRAFAKYEWRVNGVLKGTGSTYKPTSADRGDYLKVTVKYYRFGFNSVTKVSKSYRIS